MKNIAKGSEPPKLATFRQISPQGTWINCRNNKNRLIEIQTKLLEDQGGLCAYCEIDLKAGSNGKEADFRVEHFHPKSVTSTGHNWHLDWGNLLACCHGGSRPDIVDAAHRSSSPDHSCDVPKENKNLSNVILNPLQLPAFPSIFSYTRYTGSISIHSEHCTTAGVSPDMAKNTIDELRLDADRLKRLRNPVLNKVNDELSAMLSRGIDIEQAKETLAKAYFRRNSNGHWPKFFSALRHYLGDAAERQLSIINYVG